MIPSIINRMFNHTREGETAPGMLVLPLEVPYSAQIIHATYRNLNRPSRNARQTHTHDVYHILLVTGGRGHFVIGKDQHPVEAGLLFITSPGEWHSFSNAEGEDSEYCEITFEFKNRAGQVLTRPFHEVLSAWTGRPCERIGYAQAGPELHLLLMQQIERLVKVGFAQEQDFALYLQECLGRIFLGLYTLLYRSPQTAPSAHSLLPVHDYIHKHFNQPLSLRRLARLAGLTPNYLSRRFKARYGMTPIYFQHRLRIQTAAGLLRTTQYPIKQIAEIVGFSDVYFFSKVFKKVQGAPPGAYRKK